MSSPFEIDPMQHNLFKILWFGTKMRPSNVYVLIEIIASLLSSFVSNLEKRVQKTEKSVHESRLEHVWKHVKSGAQQPMLSIFFYLIHICWMRSPFKWSNFSKGLPLIPIVGIFTNIETRGESILFTFDQFYFLTY